MSTASTASFEFLKKAGVPADETINADNIMDVRQVVRSGFQERIDRIKETYRPTLRYSKIADVECLHIIPEVCDHSSRLVYCYGGGFVTGSPEEDLLVTAPLASLLGFEIISPRYRLAPEYPYPCAVQDCLSVYKHIVADSDNHSVSLMGESAGGNAALAIIQMLAKDAGELPLSLTLLSPWCDLMHSGESHTFNDGRDPTIRLSFVKQAAAMYAEGNSLSDSDISPIQCDFQNPFPPTFITTGSRDLLLSQSLSLHQKLLDANIQAEINVWENMWHVFEFYDELPEALTSLSRIARFIQSFH